MRGYGETRDCPDTMDGVAIGIGTEGQPHDGAGDRFELDEGFRAWYAACSCCLGETTWT